MDRVSVRRVEFFAPGSIVANTWSVEHDEYAPIDWPERAYAYQLWIREELHDNGKVFRGDDEKIGKLIYHPDSTITTLEQVKTGETPGPVGPVLVANMECNHWDSVVWTRWGNWPQPWEPDRMEIAA